MTRITKRIKVMGVVQGVGFRPFIFKIATTNNLTGYIINKGSFVEILVQGEVQSINQFLNDFNLQIPPLAKIESSFTEVLTNYIINHECFTIENSKSDNTITNSYIPPDVAICDHCLTDMNEGDRKGRLNYPFTSCVDCGPRFTIIKELPYDRHTTTMDKFPLCEQCLKEYTNPLNRRYHAQTTCCNECGPKYKIFDSTGKIIIVKENEAPTFISEKLNNGKIVAIKGIGGTHIACSVSLSKPIQRLRKSKGDRRRKPFAVMSLSINDVYKYAQIPNKAVEELLSSNKRPIVLLPKKDPFPLNAQISPNLGNIGVMLPYAGIHYQILKKVSDHTLIFTSANHSHEPIQIDNKEIINELKDVVDYFFLHDRDIFQRADDSVIKPLLYTSQVMQKNISIFIRKSRGYVPIPINIPNWKHESAIIGVSSELHTTSSIAIRGKLFLSQYIGNLKYEKTLKFMKHSINNLLKILQNPKLEVIIGDLHPTYISTELGKEISDIRIIEFFQVQHHFAHASALLGENQLFSNKAIVFVGDGLGYGEDGNIWGGEFLIGTIGDFKRINHWDYVQQPGGDLATKNPIRMVISYLINTGMKDEEILNDNSIFKLDKEELLIIIQQCRKNINVPLTSSTGRFLDAVSVLLNLTRGSSYEGEPAIVFESFTLKNNSNIAINNNPILDEYLEETSCNTNISKLFRIIFEKMKEKMKSPELALYTHHALGYLIAKECLKIAKNQENTKYIGFSGGVGYNDIIISVFCDMIIKNNYIPLLHEKLPPGDGCISAGQCFYYAHLNTNRKR